MCPTGLTEEPEPRMRPEGRTLAQYFSNSTLGRLFSLLRGLECLCQHLLVSTSKAPEQPPHPLPPIPPGLPALCFGDKQHLNGFLFYFLSFLLAEDLRGKCTFVHTSPLAEVLCVGATMGSFNSPGSEAIKKYFTNMPTHKFIVTSARECCVFQVLIWSSPAAWILSSPPTAAIVAEACSTSDCILLHVHNNHTVGSCYSTVVI